MDREAWIAILVIFFILISLFLLFEFAQADCADDDDDISPDDDDDVTPSEHSITFLCASIGGSVWDCGPGKQGLAEELEEEWGIGPNGRWWNGRFEIYYYKWRDFYSLFTDPYWWDLILTTDCPDCEHTVVMFKICVGPGMYWNEDDCYGDQIDLAYLRFFMQDHPNIFFIIWNYLPHCAIQYVGDYPHLPYLSALMSEWMKGTFDELPNARVFDCWSILADEDGLLKEEYQKPHEPEDPCDFHPDEAGLLEMKERLLELILYELNAG